MTAKWDRLFALPPPTTANISLGLLWPQDAPEQWLLFWSVVVVIQERIILFLSLAMIYIYIKTDTPQLMQKLIYTLFRGATTWTATTAASMDHAVGEEGLTGTPCEPEMTLEDTAGSGREVGEPVVGRHVHPLSSKSIIIWSIKTRVDSAANVGNTQEIREHLRKL